MSDTRKLRAALQAAGFVVGEDWRWPPMIWNDRHKSGDTRRLKVWSGNPIFNAPQWQQKQLEAALEAQFGDRLMLAQFVPSRSRRYSPNDGTYKSFCVYLFTE